MAINLYKPFGVKFLERIGGTTAEIFVFNYLPALFAALFLIPSLLFIRRLNDSGRAGGLFLLLSRSLLVPTAMVPLLPAAWQPMAFLILFSLLNSPDAISQSSIQSYLGSAFSPDNRHDAFSRRLAVGQLVIAITVLTSGLILRGVPRSNSERIMLYQIVFIASFGIGLFEYRAFRKFRNIAGTQAVSFNLKTTLRRMAGERRFLKFMLCSVLFNLGWTGGWPLIAVWQVKFLHADEIWLALIAVISSLVCFFSYGFWRKFITKRGLGAALGLSTLGQAINPIVIVLANTLPLQLAVQVFTNFFTAGVVVSFLAAQLATSPDTDDKIGFMAIYNTAINLVQVLAQMLGLILYKATNIWTSMYVDAGVRLIGALAFVALFRDFGRIGPGGVSVKRG
jgi:hypothetical protein